MNKAMNQNRDGSPSFSYNNCSYYQYFNSESKQKGPKSSFDNNQKSIFFPNGFGSPKSELNLLRREIFFRKQEKDKLNDRIIQLERENRKLRSRLELEANLAANYYCI